VKDIASMSSQKIELSVVDTTGGLLALREEWNDLWGRSDGAHFFHSFGWCWHIWNFVAAPRGRKLHVVIGKQARRLVLIWPLMIDGRTLRMLSSDTLEYRDLIVEKSPHANYWMTMAWNAVTSTPGVDLVLLQNLRSPSNIDQLLNGMGRTPAVVGGWCSVIRLDKYATWESYVKQWPKSMISDQRRQWKRAKEALPSVSFKLITDGNDIGAIIDWIIRHKVQWLRARNKSWSAENLASREMRAFFHAASQSAHDEGSLVLAKLSDGNIIISAGFGYRFRSDFLFHMFTYDLTWSRISPSRLFLEELVRWCFSQSIRTFDLMPGGETYKTIWANELVRTDTYAESLTLWGEYLLRWHLPLAEFVRVPEIVTTGYRYFPERLRQKIRTKLTRLNMLGLVGKIGRTCRYGTKGRNILG